ncbi:MAG: hypothetical protein ACK58L_04040 [Planctomycetota bacterium]
MQSLLFAMRCAARRGSGNFPLSDRASAAESRIIENVVADDELKSYGERWLEVVRTHPITTSATQAGKKRAKSGIRRTDDDVATGDEVFRFTVLISHRAVSFKTAVSALIGMVQ